MKQIALVIARRFITAVRTLRGSEGITLMELMIVIAIIGILSLIIVPRFMDIPQKARVEACKQQIAAFGIALDRYNLDNGTYPTTEQGLDALVKKPSSEPSPMNYNDGGYLKKKEVPKDPWGGAYMYTSPGQNGNEYEIMSYGADGKESGEGPKADIKSWE
jgi:general secretion pathway protein G